MKAITLQQAYDLISSASAVIVDDDGLCYPSLDELTGQTYNEWLRVSWDDGEGLTYDTRFIEEHTEILFDGSSIYMKDHEDEDCKITLLKYFNEVESLDVTH